MKNLAKIRMKKLVIAILLASFLISNFFSIKDKKQAQSNFYENALSFLLLMEDDADFIQTLEKFNKENPKTSVIYINKDEDIYYNPSNLKVDTFRDNTNKNNKDIKTISVSEGIFKSRVSYIVNTDKLLVLSTINGLSFYISPMLLLFHMLIALIALLYISRSVDRNIDRYLARLKPENTEKLANNKSYAEIYDLFTPYMEKISKLEDKNYTLSSRLREFNTITSNMKEGFILFDGFGNVELINDSAKKYLGVDDKANLSNLIDAKEYTLALKEASLLKRSKNLDININGYNLRIFIDPLSTSTKKAFAMIVIDNTEEKKAEQMRREFSANVTHELKSPLTSINGYAELIATGIAKENDISKFGEIIYEEGNRLLEIIDDILKISRLDEKNFERDFVEVDIYEVVNATIEKFDRIAASKELTITNNIKSYRIHTAKSLFHDLVSNIFENAIKYNRFGGSITVDYDLGENSYYLIIKDTGIGISKADQARIFERFYVVDKSRKRNQKSTGLGLSIVKHISSYLGYDIKVDSDLGKGSKFIIEIPLELDREI